MSNNLIINRVNVCICMFLVLVSCTDHLNNPSNHFVQKTEIKESVQSEKETPSVIMPVKSPKVLFKLQGSNTIGEKLAPSLASEYLISLGAESVMEVELEKENEKSIQAFLPSFAQVVSVEIKAHGSSTSFDGFSKNNIDIGMSSRPIKENERLNLMPYHGDLSLPGNENVIGLDGLAIITHPLNPVKKLTVKQLALIFSGEINNWKSLGGNDAVIEILARDHKSGTYDSFKSMVLKPYSKNLVATALRFESNTHLSESVKLNVNAIGFTGMAYVADNNLISVAYADNFAFIQPSDFLVNTEDYPLVRRLFFYISGKQKANKHIKEFVNFSLSNQGQKIVAREKFVSQNVYSIDHKAQIDDPIKYQMLTLGYSRLSLNFRLKPENSKLDTKANKDLIRLADFINNNENISQIRIIGFTDNVANEDYNIQRSKRRAYIISRGLREHGIRNTEFYGLGTSLPLASDSTQDGRDKNSRIEIWVKDESSAQNELAIFN